MSLVIPGYGKKARRTVDDILQNFAQTVSDLQGIIVDRMTAHDKNIKLIADIQAENQGHTEEVERAQRVQAKLNDLLK